MQGNSQLVFSPDEQSRSSCASVTIVVDDTFEGEETHCLTLQSSDPDIVVGAQSFTCILIMDENSK